MFDAEETKEALFGRVGWSDDNSVKQADGTPVMLSDKNKSSKSGRVFQGVHGAVTLSKIYHTMEQVDADTESFNQHLDYLQYSAILNSLSAVFNEDILIEQSLVFNRASDKRLDVKQNGAIKRGFKFTVCEDHSYVSVIKNLSFMFAQSGTINIVVEHNNAGVLYEQVVDVIANREIIIPIDWHLSYNSLQNKGGYFFVYYQDDLTPVEFDCPGFNKTNLFKAEPFEGDDLNNVSFTSNTYGLNMEVCVYRDFTEVIKRNAMVFDTLVGLQMAANVIERIINTDRSNMTERLSKESVQALYNDLNIAYSTPEYPYSTGIRNQISREVKRVKKNLFPKGKINMITPCSSSRIIR